MIGPFYIPVLHQHHPQHAGEGSLWLRGPSRATIVFVLLLILESHLFEAIFRLLWMWDIATVCHRMNVLMVKDFSVGLTNLDIQNFYQFV